MTIDIADYWREHGQGRDTALKLLENVMRRHLYHYDVPVSPPSANHLRVVGYALIAVVAVLAALIAALNSPT